VLTEVKIRAAGTGMHADGNGLYLQVRQGTVARTRFSKSWVFRFQLNGRRREMGLGSLALVPARTARLLALDARRLVLDGIDPLERRNELATTVETKSLPSAVKTVTFKDVALDYIDGHSAGWRNAKHRQQWENTLVTYAFPVIGETPISEVDEGLVLEVLRPIWLTRTETATRVRSRIETVLDAARANRLRSGENPARWKGHLALLLPKPRKVAPVRHHPALPFNEVASFMSELRAHKGMGALCLQLVVLTGVRSGEALKACWTEFDRPSETWIIPASRTKTEREHRVPLSSAAVTLIEQAAILRQNEYVFPGVRSGAPMSDMALTMLLRGMRPGITVHGFRSTFRDWVAEKTNYANELAELALGHAIGDAVEAAYRRGDMFERRRQLMEDWARWCSRPDPRGDVGKLVENLQSSIAGRQVKRAIRTVRHGGA
jgi:integrase